jgi:hypothetical protein
LPTREEEHLNHEPLDNVNFEQLNECINTYISQKEILSCIKKLKNNKASGEDHIINEYIKSTSGLFLQIYEKIFNLMFETGFLPDSWLIGSIKPIYKNKGNPLDPKNFRPNTILSCLGKLFTAILNEQDLTSLYMFKITLYIFPFILFNRSLYHSATLQTVSNAFSKSTNAQNNFFFLLFKISKNENNVKILSVVEYDFLNPNWFSSNKKTSSENTRSLSFKIAVNILPRQLRMVIGRKFLGSKGLPLFLYIGLILPISQISGKKPVSKIKLNIFS